VSTLRAPAGDPPPQTARLDAGGEIALGPLAARVADLYYAEFPDELLRYGAAGRDWCIHDNLHLFAWAFGAHRGYVVFGDQVRWLATVLQSRGYPLDRLAWDLRAAADVIADAPISESAPVGEILREGADVVRRVHIGSSP
jgi:hypothetical protein